MSDWIPIARDWVGGGQPCALITVTRTQGSTPREAGARMLICGSDQHGTIGGGKLELDASERARALIANGAPGELGVTHTYSLGATLGQCCGGKVELLIQRFGREALPFLSRLAELSALDDRYVCALSLVPSTRADAGELHRMIVTRAGSAQARAGDALDVRCVSEAQVILSGAERLRAPRWLELPDTSRRVLLDSEPDRGPGIVLFGAGHVGRALVHVLAPLGWSITWVETRDDAFPPDVPACVRRIATDVPEACVDEAPPESAFLIMTHDHGLDYTLCERVLERGDQLYCGLIGSRTKRAKFTSRLLARGMQADVLERLTCPIGLPELSGKAPFEVAISAAAQLLAIPRRAR